MILMEEVNINELVKVEQMAVIKQQLDIISELVQEKTKDIEEVLDNFSKLTIEQQEEKKQDIKKYKTYLNSLSKQLEDKRKEIKKEINKPYDEFNTYYEEKVKILLDKGVCQLSETINEIETKQKKDKEDALREFANNYFDGNNIQDIVKFEDIKLNITLSATEKALKEQVVNFVNKTLQDLELIKMEEYKNEILIEYKNCLDFALAKMRVVERHKQIEEMNKKQEERQVIEQQEEKVIEVVDSVITPPKEIIQEDELIIFQFTIKATKEQARELKTFLEERGIIYE